MQRRDIFLIYRGEMLIEPVGKEYGHFCTERFIILLVFK